jgi:hypothetical protein
MEKFFDINPESLTEDDYELKFFVWSRKIIEGAGYYEDNNYDEEKIRNYLQVCADLREKFLTKEEMTDTEDYYTDEAHEIFQYYSVIDPLY